METCCCSSALNRFVFPQAVPTLSSVISRRDAKGLRVILRTLKKGECAGSASGRLVRALAVATERGDPNTPVPVSEDVHVFALHEAVRCQLHDVVDMLLEARADVEIRDCRGQTALQIAACSQCSNLISILERGKHIEDNEHFEETLSWLQDLRLFRRLKRAELPRLAAAFEHRHYAKDEFVFREGEAGNDLFVVEKGSVRMFKLRGDKRVALRTLGPGEPFGEIALLDGAPRTCSAQACDGRLEVQALSRSDFDKLGLRKKLKLKRKAMRQADGNQARPPDTICAKSPQEFALVRNAILRNELLGPLLRTLSSSALDDIVRKAYAQQVGAGDVVITQGELRADTCYIIQEGRVQIVVDGKMHASEGPGYSFGERGLLWRHSRTATVRATTAARLWVLSRQALRAALQAPLKRKLEHIAGLVDSVEVFECVSAPEERQALVEALVQTEFNRGEYIMKQGEHGDSFFILEEGEVAIEIDGKEIRRLQSNSREELPAKTPKSTDSPYYPNNCFGDRALLYDEPRSASVRVVSQRVLVFVIHRDAFAAVRDMAMGRKRSDTVSSTERTVRADTYLSEGETVRFSRIVSRQLSATFIDAVRYDFSQLETLGLLGCGAFGKVTLVKCGVTGQTLALKAVSKGYLVQEDNQKSVIHEKIILQMTSSPFLIRLAATFNRDQHVYFLMEAALGGELYAVYENMDLWGSELHARFYIACVVLAFEHLHQQLVAYRDLKPENLLLDARGYCKVTDFGLAKFTVGHTYTMCGTPDYFAPEMVLGAGHTMAVDWWSLGVLVYELIMGHTPFHADDPMVIFAKVKRGIESADAPAGNPAWYQLTKGLCHEEPGARLPLQNGGIKNVQDHKWYTAAAFDWLALANRAAQAPYTPHVTNQGDIFQEDAEEPDFVHYVDDGSGWDADFEDVVGPRVV